MKLKTFLKLMDSGLVKLTGGIQCEPIDKEDIFELSEIYGFDLGEYIVDGFFYSKLYNCILVETSKGE